MKRKGKIASLFAKSLNLIKSNKKLALLIVSLILVLSLSVSYAWFNGRNFKLNTDEKESLATLSSLDGKVDVIGYSLKNGINNSVSLQQSIFAVEGETGVQGAKFIDDDGFLPGALNGVAKLSLEESSIIEQNSKTKIVKVTNKSDMDILVKIQFNIASQYTNDLTSFWYLVTNVTSNINSADPTEYTGGTELSELDKKIYVYLSNNKASRSNSFNELNINTRTFDNLKERVTLGEIKEPTTDYVNGNTEYYRIDYGLSESVLRASGSNYFNKDIKLDAYVYYGQVNAPDESDPTEHNNIVEVYTAEELQNVLNNVNLAYYGDTIKLMDDIVITPQQNSTTLDVTRPLNLDTNKHKLEINAPLNITYQTAMDIKIDVTKRGQLIVHGDISFTVPNGSVKLVGANERSSGEANADIIMYSDSTGVHQGEQVQIKNGVGQNGNGLELESVYIANMTFRPTTNKYAVDNEVIVMGAASKLIVRDGVEIDEVSSGEITNVQIYNYGTIGWIHLNSMNLPTAASRQIYIYNNYMIRGSIYDLNGDPVDHSLDAIKLPISSTPANTEIVKGIYSNNFNVSGSDNFTNSDVKLEKVTTQYVTAIKNENNAYRVYVDLTLTGSIGGSIIRYALEHYFDDPEETKGIEKLVIESTTDTYITDRDFDYFKSENMRDLMYLDLTLVNVKDLDSTNGTNKIPNDAMKNKVGLKTILLPNTLKYIGTNAFYGTSIQSITIPSNLISVGSQAFYTEAMSECVLKAFIPISNPNNFLPAFRQDVYYLVDEAAIDDYKDNFKQRSSFIANHVYCYSEYQDKKYIRLLEDGTMEIVAYTGDIADQGLCPSSIDYLGNDVLVTSIGRDAYVNVTAESGNSQSITIADGITTINKYAFASVQHINTVITSSAEYIGEYAFYNCQSLKTIIIGGENIEIKDFAFYNCSKLEDVRMTGAKKIGNNSFDGCKEIKNLSIPDVTYIGANAFRGCIKFESVEFGFIETISDSTFKGCISLKILGLTSETVNIGKEAFSGCTSLETIYPYGDNQRKDGYAYLKYVKNIGDNAFYNCTNLKYVYFDQVETIGTNAFRSCTKLETVDANTVTSIGNYAFYNDKQLTIINMESVLTIGTSAFESDNKILYALIPNATSIGEKAFYYSSSIIAIELGDATIGQYAFYNVRPRYIDLSNYEFPSGYESTTVYPTFGGSNLWHDFTSSTKYYFAKSSDPTYTTARKQFIFRILKNSARNGSGIDRNMIYEKGTFLGNYFVSSLDHDSTLNGIGSRTELGLIKNLYLYNVEINQELRDMNNDGTDDKVGTIVSYHGPNLVGNVVIPFKEYLENGISDDDFNTAKTSTNNGDLYHVLDTDFTTKIYIDTIGEYAFYVVGASGATETTFNNVTFASTVTLIKKGAFQSSKIQFLYMNQVTKIEASAFRTANQLRYVDLGMVSEIGNYAFTEVTEQQDINGVSTSDGSDVAKYFSGQQNNIGISTGLLTKVIFRHVKTIGEAVFLKYPSNRKTKLLLLDFTTNVPDSSATNGVGPSHNINAPSSVGTYWMGPSISEGSYWESYRYYDVYVLAPYYETESSTIAANFKKISKTDQILYDFGYWYEKDYKVNDVEVGMFMLRPPTSGDVSSGFYIYKSFLRNIGASEYETGVASRSEISIVSVNTKTNKVARIKYTIPSSLTKDEITVTNGTVLADGTYKLKLYSSSFTNTTVATNIYCNLDFGDDFTSIPSNCFGRSQFRDVYTNNVESIGTYAFYGNGLGTLYCEHLKSISDYFLYYGSIEIIDVRNNTYSVADEEKGKKVGDMMVVSFSSRFVVEASIKGIYVTSAEYEEYREETKNIIIHYSDYSNDYETNIELQLYVLVPGVYFGEINLLNTTTYDLKGLIAPYTTKETDTIYWKVVGENPNSNYDEDNEYAYCTDGIISLRQYSGRPRTEGTFYVVCYREYDGDDSSNPPRYKDLLCKFKVNIMIDGTTTLTYYNIEEKQKTIKIDDEYKWFSGVRILKFYGRIATDVIKFNPSTELTKYLDNVVSKTELARFKNTDEFKRYDSSYTITSLDGVGEYKAIEIGVGAYYSMSIDPSITVYLITDKCLQKIEDYSFYRVGFYEIWLTNVTEIGRKSFTNGSSQNNLTKVVMPKIREIGDEAFSHNRSLTTIVVDDDFLNTSVTSYYVYGLQNIGSKAFYVNNRLERFGVVKENLDTLTSDDIVNGNYTLTFIKDRVTVTTIDPETYEEITTTTDYFYNSTDRFIYLENNVESIGTYAFYQTILIQEIRMPENYYFTTISSYAFAYNRALTYVRMSDRIRKIDSYAFFQCDILPDLQYTVDEEDEEIETITGGIDLRNVYYINEGAFKQCYLLREIELDSIKSIGKQAFNLCTNLRFIYFDEVNAYEKVTFGNGWSEGTHPLLRCYVSQYNKQYFEDAVVIYYKEAVAYTTNPTVGDLEYVVNYIKNGTGQITGVKIACYNGITANIQDDNYLEQIPATLTVEGVEYAVTQIGKYAYKGFKIRNDAGRLETLILPESVKNVESYAFSSCEFVYYQEKLENDSNIQEVTYGDRVFYNNSYLKSATFRRMASGGAYFYDACENMKNMHLDDNVNKYNIYTAPIISDDFFTGSRNDCVCNIKAGTIGLFNQVGYVGRVYESGDELGDYIVKNVTGGIEIVRYKATSITSDYTVPTDIEGKTVMSIGLSAYSNIIVSSNLTLTIPASIKSVGNYAFFELGFKNVVILGTDTTFGENVFQRNMNLQTVSMPNLTTLTGKALFKDCSQLLNVTYNDSVTKIPEEYFMGCTNLAVFDLKLIEEIGANAFNGCSTLSSIYSSKVVGSNLVAGKAHFGNVKTIKDSAFEGCSNLRVLDLSNATTVGKYAFKNCTNLTEIKETTTSTVVNEGAFYNCSSVTGVIIQFKSVPDYCFYGCTSLQVLRLEKPTQIGNYAFYNCSKITDVDLNNVLTVGNYAFYNCSSIDTLSIGRANAIGNYAFNLCKKITSINFNNLETIGEHAFDNCNITGDLDLKNVQVIENYAFANNIYLKNVTFKRVTRLGNYVFSKCIRIESFNFSENGILENGVVVQKEPTTVYGYVFNETGQNPINFVIYVPVNNSALMEQYRTKFYNYKPYIFEYGTISSENPLYMVKNNGDNTLTIIRYLGDSLSTDYNIPTKLDNMYVTRIGDYAYYKLGILEANVNKLNLGTNVTYVGDYAFYGLDFEVIAMPEVTYIGQYAFAYNDGLTYISLTKVANIKNNAFYKNTNLQIVRFYDTIREIGNNAFDGSNELRNVYLVNDDPSVITVNGSNQVFGSLVKSYLKVRVPSSTISAYKAKFTYYKDVIVAGSISDADFSYREVDGNIEIVSYEGQEINVTIPDMLDSKPVVKILEDAFMNSLNIESITLPSTLTSISSHAFYTNSTIKHVYVTAGSNNVFVSVNDCLYMKDSSGIIKTLIYYPVQKTDKIYSFNSTGSYDLSQVDRIYENAFYGNKYIEEIEVPSTIRYIGECAFAETPSLKKLTFKAPISGTAVVPTLYGTNILSTEIDTLDIYVPSQALDDYKNDEYFGYYKRYIKALS